MILCTLFTEKVSSFAVFSKPDCRTVHLPSATGDCDNECICNCLSLHLFLRNHLHLLVDPGLLLLALALGLQHLQQLLDALVPGAQRLLLGVYPHLQLLGTEIYFTIIAMPATSIHGLSEEQERKLFLCLDTFFYF